MASAALLPHVRTASIDHGIAADPVAIPVLQRFTSVRVHASTTIRLPDALTTTWSGCGNTTKRGTAGLKCGIQIDLLTGALCGFDLAHGRASDQVLPIQHAPLLPGSLRLADQPERSLLATLAALGPVAQWDGHVAVGKHGRLVARLLVRRVPQAVADERRRRLRATAKAKGRAPAQAALALAAWNILITNVPQDKLSLDAAMVMMRLRWQIELLFKLWKSDGHVDEWRTEKPARILCEVYAKLLALVFQHWMMVASSWGDPERSMVKAAQIVRSYAAELASAQCHIAQRSAILMRMSQVLHRLARTNRRTTTPQQSNVYWP